MNEKEFAVWLRLMTERIDQAATTVDAFNTDTLGHLRRGIDELRMAYTYVPSVEFDRISAELTEAGKL